MLGVRIPDEINEQLQRLSDQTGQSKSYFVKEALEKYLASQAWQVKHVQEAVAEADDPDTRWIPQEDIELWLEEQFR